MAAHEYLEDLSSLLPAVGLLNQLGYQYLTPSQNLALRGGRTSKLILESVLREQLRKFNSITFKGQQYAFSDSNIQKAVQALTDIPFDSLMNTSEQVYDLLTLGKSLEQTIDGYTKSFSCITSTGSTRKTTSITFAMNSCWNVATANKPVGRILCCL